ncbi:MAG: hypothetical protein ACREVA_00290 [Burkholderiales bacterium]
MSTPNPNGQKNGKDSDFIRGGLGAVTAWFPELPKPIKWVMAIAFLYLLFCLVAQISPTIGVKTMVSGIANIVANSRVPEQQAAVERTDYLDYLREELKETRKEIEAVESIKSQVIDLQHRVDIMERIHKTQLENLRRPVDQNNHPRKAFHQ